MADPQAEIPDVTPYSNDELELSPITRQLRPTTAALLRRGLGRDRVNGSGQEVETRGYGGISETAAPKAP